MGKFDMTRCQRFMDNNRGGTCVGGTGPVAPFAEDKSET